MSWFIATKQPEFHHQVIVELGAGAGLAGFIASQLGSHTVITDGNEVHSSFSPS